MIIATWRHTERRRAARAEAVRRRQRLEMHVIHTTAPAPTIGTADDGGRRLGSGKALVLIGILLVIAAALAHV